MSASVSVAVMIDAPIETTWAFVAVIDSHVEWMKDAVSIRFRTARHGGVGTVFECATRVGPIRLNDVMSVTEWTPPKAMAVDHRGRGVRKGSLHS